MRRSLVFVFLCILVCALAGAALPSFQDRYVNDFAQILAPEDASLLRTAFEIVEENTTAQLVFVSLPTIEGNDLSEYALALGEAWGVGQKEKDNGVVILYVHDVNRIWVSTGYGVEGVLPDSKVGRLLDTYYVPLRDEGNLSAGILELGFALSQELVDNASEIAAPPKDTTFQTVLIVSVVLLILIIIFYSIRARRFGRGTFFPVFIPSGGHSHMGGFGGGHFGGGGAGR